MPIGPGHRPDERMGSHHPCGMIRFDGAGKHIGLRRLLVLLPNASPHTLNVVLRGSVREFISCGIDRAAPLLRPPAAVQALRP